MSLPDFLVIGALKCGTTSLHNLLGAHPDVFTPSGVKEISYFAYDGGEEPGFPVRARTLREYARFFDAADDHQIVGEVSPTYLASPVAPYKIARERPQARLIAVLREPVARAYSHYLMTVRAGRRRFDPAELFDDAAETYVRRSFYADDLSRFLDRFDEDQVKVVLFEDFRADTRSVMRDLYDFVGASREFEPPVEYRGKGYLPRSAGFERLLRSPLARGLKGLMPATVRRAGRHVHGRLNTQSPPSLPEEARRRARGMFDEDMERIERLTGLDLDVWRHRGE